MSLTPHFTLSEATVTSTGVPNEPSESQLATIYRTALRMEDVRKLLGGPIYVNSWFRSPQVNAVVGGVPTSQHSKGEAVDFICPSYGNPAKICEAIVSSEINFDQLILEPTWVHISFTRHGGRKEVLTKVSNGYVYGLRY